LRLSMLPGVAWH